MKNLKVLALCFCLVGFLPLKSAAVDKNELIIHIEKGSRGEVYLFDRKKVSLVELYDALVEKISSDKNARVLVISDEEIPISKTVNLRGLIQKVGFQDIKYFFTGAKESLMSEYQFVGYPVPAK